MCYTFLSLLIIYYSRIGIPFPCQVIALLLHYGDLQAYIGIHHSRYAALAHYGSSPILTLCVRMTKCLRGLEVEGYADGGVTSHRASFA